MRRHEVRARFDRIVEFAELGEFLDTPVRFYSSGMTVRLGFAVAIHTEPDVLLVDEVLSVGDLEFQARCLERIEQLRAAGTTFLFVSHDLSKVGRLCPSTLVLSRGRAQFLGETQQAIDVYRESVLGESGSAGGNRLASPELEIKDVEFLDDAGRPANEFAVGAPLRVRVHYRAAQPIDEAPLNVAIFRGGDLVQAAGFRSDVDGFRCGPLARGGGSIDLVIPACNLLPGHYVVSVTLWQPGSLAPYAWHLHGYRFSITGGLNVGGLAHLPHQWEVGGASEGA
jgi:lipopolysaccharide transport system ATP-binding protein